MKKNCVSIKSFNDINYYISVKIERNGELNNLQKGEEKVVIYVRDDPVIIIPGTYFSSFKDAIEELSEKSHLHNKNNEEMTIEVLFTRLCFDIHTWSENNYGSQYLHFKISLPLLKKLRDVGETKFQIIFQQEILTRYATSTARVKGFLEQEGYLKLISDFF